MPWAPLVVAGRALDADDGAGVELPDGPCARVGERAAYAGDDLVEDVLDAGALGVEEHPARGDALLEERRAGPVEGGQLPGAVLDGPRGRHTEGLLVEAAVDV